MNCDELRQLVERVDRSRLLADVSRLATGERHGLFSPEHHKATLDHIRAVFSASDLEIRKHTFDHEGRTGVNLIGHIQGTEPGLAPLLVCAHYDTVANSPGADDNASGVAAMLECARVMAGTPLPRSVQFAAFDMEEVQPDGEGLVGSAAFVQDVGTSIQYEGVYNLEMIGFTSGQGTQTLPEGFQILFPAVYNHMEERSFSGDSIPVVSLGGTLSLGQRMKAAAQKYVPDLDVVPIEMQIGMPIPPDVFRSDHASFWAAGVPAAMITDTANFRNPHYHTPTDTADTLDYAFLHSVTRTLVAGVASHAAG